jgi:hypothetical protein
MHRTRPSSSAAVARAVAAPAPLLDRHVLWLVAGMLIAFLGAMLTTIALIDARRGVAAATITTTTTVTVAHRPEAAGGTAWRTLKQRVVVPAAAGRAGVRVDPRVFVW